MNRRGFFQTIGFGAIAAAVAKVLPKRKRKRLTRAKVDAMMAKFPKRPTRIRWAVRSDDGSLCWCDCDGGPLPDHVKHGTPWLRRNT